MFSFEWYVDKPKRKLNLVPEGSRVWVDIEPGCFEVAEDVRAEGTRLTESGLLYGTYGNRPSIEPVFGNSDELKNWPLWYANYEAPVWARFESFNGFYAPQKWQFSDSAYSGINMDLSMDAQGRMWGDFGNYTVVSPRQADIVVATLFGIIIGLQDEGIAQWNYEALKAAVNRIEPPPV